jgi:hypothetical protein
MCGGHFEVASFCQGGRNLSQGVASLRQGAGGGVSCLKDCMLKANTISARRSTGCVSCRSRSMHQVGQSIIRV